MHVICPKGHCLSLRGSACDPRSRLSISSFHTLRNFCPSTSFDSGLIFINFTLGKADLMSAILKFISLDVAEDDKVT